MMLKKTFVVLLALTLLLSTAAFASEQEVNIFPGKGLLQAMRSIQEAQGRLVESAGEKAAIFTQTAEQRLAFLENPGENHRYCAALAGDLANYERRLGQTLEEAKGGPDADRVVALVEADTVRRGERLRAMLEAEDIPDEAKEGIQQALKNQARAMEHCREALRKAEGNWERAQEQAGCEENNGGNGEEGGEGRIIPPDERSVGGNGRGGRS